jgi:hypothetical protein
MTRGDGEGCRGRLNFREVSVPGGRSSGARETKMKSGSQSVRRLLALPLRRGNLGGNSALPRIF